MIIGVRALALAPYLEPRGVYFILVLSTGEAENESCRPPGPDQGARARAPTRPAPSALPRSAFAVPARTALRACAPLAILTVPACSLGRRATAETASAADAGPGGRGCTRARESSRLVLLRRLGGVRGRRRSRVARRRRHFAAAVCVCVCVCVCHLSEVFLMPNTHTGPGAGRWEGGGVQTSGRYNLIFRYRVPPIHLEW